MAVSALNSASFPLKRPKVAPAILKNDFQSVFLIKNEPRAYAFGSFDLK